MVACGNEVHDDLSPVLDDPQVLTAGDCVAPRTITEAIREGRLAGRSL